MTMLPTVNAISAVPHNQADWHSFLLNRMQCAILPPLSLFSVHSEPLDFVPVRLFSFQQFKKPNDDTKNGIH